MTVQPSPSDFAFPENDPEMDKLMAALGNLGPIRLESILSIANAGSLSRPAAASRANRLPYARQMYARPANAPLTGGF